MPAVAPAIVAGAVPGCVLSLTSRADDMQADLSRYNSLELSESAQLCGADTCTECLEHVPE